MFPTKSIVIARGSVPVVPSIVDGSAFAIGEMQTEDKTVKIKAITLVRKFILSIFNNSPLQMSYKHLLALGLDELSPDSAKRGRLNRS